MKPKRQPLAVGVPVIEKTPARLQVRDQNDRLLFSFWHNLISAESKPSAITTTYYSQCDDPSACASCTPTHSCTTYARAAENSIDELNLFLNKSHSVLHILFTLTFIKTLFVELMCEIKSIFTGVRTTCFIVWLITEEALYMLRIIRGSSHISSLFLTYSYKLSIPTVPFIALKVVARAAAPTKHPTFRGIISILVIKSKKLD